MIGAGYLGLAMAEALTLRGLDVTLVDRDRQVMPPLDRALSPQASYDAMRLFAEAARFPASRDAELFCARLERLREGSP